MKEKFSFPDLSLVVLIGASGSGKSTFARKHFLPTEVISSDYCRALVSDDENNLAATNDAFEILHFIAGKRLAAGRLTVADATNVKPEDRKPLIELARQYHCLPVAIVLNMPERLCQDRNQVRTDRRLGNHVAHRQLQNLRRSLRGLEREGFRHVLIVSSPEEADSIVLERVPLYNNKKTETGPFDIIGDIHGCYDELTALLMQLGYVPAQTNGNPTAQSSFIPPAGRKAVFLGDLTDRGPNSPGVLRLVMHMVSQGSRTAFLVITTSSSFASFAAATSGLPTASPRHSRNSTKSRRNSALRSPSFSTLSSATMFFTKAAWSSPTPE